MDVFLQRSYTPMLIGRDMPAFDDDNYLFELKLDGIRCLAYLDGESMALITRRGLEISSRFPELADIRKNITGTCILDGELVVLSDGIPDFEKVKDRTLSTDRIKADRLAKAAPTTFVVFDLLYLDGEELIKKPLAERRKQLESVVSESDRIALTRIIEGAGVSFSAATKEQGLEGIIAKRKESLYYPGKRSSDWVKCKNVLDDDFVICGYIYNANNSISLVLGQYDKHGTMIYKGHVVLNEGEDDYPTVLALSIVDNPPFAEPLPANNKDALWVELTLVCRVAFLSRTESGLRHPVFKGLRIDKAPEDTFIPQA